MRGTAADNPAIAAAPGRVRWQPPIIAAAVGTLFGDKPRRNTSPAARSPGGAARGRIAGNTHCKGPITPKSQNLSKFLPFAGRFITQVVATHYGILGKIQEPLSKV